MLILSFLSSAYRCLTNLAIQSDPLFALAHLPEPHAIPSLVCGGGGQQLSVTSISTLLGLDEGHEEGAGAKGTLTFPWGTTNSLAVRRDSKIFAAGGGDIRLVDSRKKRFLATLRFHRESVGGVAYPRQLLGAACAGDDVLGRETWLAAGARDGNVSIWDLYPQQKKE